MRAANQSENRNGNTSLGWEDKAWVDQELDGAYFQDVRLGKRLRTLLGLMSNGLGQTIPLACQDWANTKAAYRFFSNARINEEEILSGHFASTQTRAAAIQESYWEKYIWLPVGPEASLAEGLCGALGDAEFCRSVFRCLGAAEGMKFLRGIEQLGNARRQDRLDAAYSIALRHQVSCLAQPESWREGLEMCRSMAEDHAWSGSELGRKLRSCWRYGLILFLFEGSRLVFKENEPREAVEILARALERVDAWFVEITGDQPMVRFWECDENADWEIVGDFLLRQPNCLTGGTNSQWGGPKDGVIPKLQVGWWDEFVRWAEGKGYAEAPVLLAYTWWLLHKMPEATELERWCRALEAKLRPG